MKSTRKLISIAIACLDIPLCRLTNDQLEAVHFYMLWKDGCDESNAFQIARDSTRQESIEFLCSIFSMKEKE